MPVDTRIAVNQMVIENGAQPDVVTWGAADLQQHEDQWIDEDEDDFPLELSHEGGEHGDSISALMSEVLGSRYVCRSTYMHVRHSSLTITATPGLYVLRCAHTANVLRLCTPTGRDRCQI